MSFLSSLSPSSSQCADASCQNGAETAERATIQPTYRVTETPEAYELTVNLPGVNRESLEFTAEDGVVSVRGERRWQAPEAWRPVYRETGDEVFQLRLRHDNAVQADQVKAELRDGVLKATLPKTEAVKPRRISVN
jgi:HSP20 family protein